MYRTVLALKRLNFLNKIYASYNYKCNATNHATTNSRLPINNRAGNDAVVNCAPELLKHVATNGHQLSEWVLVFLWDVRFVVQYSRD